jgi:hypothetical protein
MKPRPIKQKDIPVLRARRGITFRREDVPEAWQPIHGKVVYRAVAAAKRTDLNRFGLESGWYVAARLGLRKVEDLVGDFSYVKQLDV